jgi:cytochrome c biogenesis protein CcmG/thiol:disulfide interchange protein DsbE
MKIAQLNQMPLVGLNWKDQDDAATDWLTKLGNPYTVVAVDRDGRAAIDFGVYGAPETFFIDADGRVQYRHVGAMTLEVWNREFVSRMPRGGLP